MKGKLLMIVIKRRRWRRLPHVCMYAFMLLCFYGANAFAFAIDDYAKLDKVNKILSR